MTPVLDPLEVDLEVELLQPLPDFRRGSPFLWKGKKKLDDMMKDSRIPSFCTAIRLPTLETDFSTLPPDLERAGDTEIALRRGDDLATEDMSWETGRKPTKVI